MINIRSNREIERMRPAGELVWRAHQAIRERIRPGVTTAELDQIVDELFANCGAEPLFKGYPGPTPFPAATCISINEQVVHGIPGSRQLRDGDIVSVDTGCRLNGWCGDAAVTHAVGNISVGAAHVLRVTQDVLAVAIESCGTCERWSQVAAKMQDFVERQGCSVVRAFVGHGIGREMHESPSVPNFCSKKFEKEDDFDLRPGIVLAIEPMVNLGQSEVRVMDDQWTQVTKDGSLSAHFEHTVALTGEGPRILTGPLGGTGSPGGVNPMR